MELNEARIIYNLLLESKHQTLVDQLLKNAVHYSSMRVEWFLSDNIERNEIDRDRTLSHNAFISSCNTLSRNMEKVGEDISWRQKIGNTREEIGDFACLINAIIGLNAR